MRPASSLGWASDLASDSVEGASDVETDVGATAAGMDMGGIDRGIGAA